MPEVLTNTNQGSPTYPVKRRAQRKGMGNVRQVKARLGPAGEAVVVDLSESGIGLELAMPLQPGSTLAVDFDLPESGGHVRVDGRVIWFGAGKRAGIRFERVPDLASERLKRWVSLGRQAIRQTLPAESVGAPTLNPAVEKVTEETTEEPLTLDRAVVQVLARAMAITKATGAAIAIGPPEAMVCRASAGNAPDIGVPINPSSGLTGYCVRSRATVRCDDTETDERVNAAACREMELRSALVVPVFSDRNTDELSGILEVSSSQPRAFSPDHIAKLEKLTKILGVVAADLIPGAESKRESSSTIVPVVNTELVIGESSPEPNLERAHLPRKIGDRPAAGPQANVSPAVPANERSAAPLQSGNTAQRKVEQQGVGQVKPAALAAPVVTSQIAARETAVKLAELTKPNTETVENSVEEIKANPRKFSSVTAVDLPTEATVLPLPPFAVGSPSFSERTREWLIAGRTQRTRIGKVLRIVGAVVIALEIAAALFLYARWEKKRAASVRSSRLVSTASAPATPVAVPQVAALLPASAPSVPKRKKQSQETLLPEDGSDDVIVVNRDGATGTSSSGASATTSQSASPKSSVTTESEPPAPAPVSGQADLAALRFPDNSIKPSLAIRMSSGTIGGKLIRRVEPAYPEMAKSRGIQGEVFLSARVGTDGVVKEVHLLKGNPFLGAAAREAVKHWRYEPMKLNGTPVEMDTSVMVKFKLPN